MNSDQEQQQQQHGEPATALVPGSSETPSPGKHDGSSTPAVTPRRTSVISTPIKVIDR